MDGFPKTLIYFLEEEDLKLQDRFKEAINNRNVELGGSIVIDYEPLWQTMKEKNITTYTLIHKHNFSPYTITNLKRNKSITMNTLEKLCKILDCQAESIVSFLDD